MNTRKILNLVMAFIFAFSLVGMPASVLAEEPQSGPTLGINPDGVWGINWTLGTSVTLTVDDTSNGTSVDYTATETVEMYDFPNPTAVFHLPTDLQIKPGFELTMTDGVVTKTLTAVYFKISNVDVAADIVSGVTEAGAQVQVWMSKGERTVTAGADGIWSVDFKIPGDLPNEDDIVDILPGDFVMAAVYDAEGDSTGDWSDAPNPSFHVQLSQNNVEGYNWMLGTSVTMTIDVDHNGTPEFTSSPQTVIEADWDPKSTMVRFNDVGGIDLAAGMYVTMTDGTMTKVHIVTVLALTSVDSATDRVTGTAAPNSYMEVGHLCDETGCAIRRITADASGNWVADFSVPGLGTDPDEQRLFDIKPGTGNEVRQPDEDGDHTDIDWSAYNPTIGVDVDIDRVQGWDWPLGETVSFEIDDPFTTENPDYTNSATVHSADWDPNLMWFEFYTNNYDVKPGDVVTATDGNITKQLIVTHFRITGADLDLDIVYGIADPSQEVRIWSIDPNATRLVTADSNGNWSANFGIPGDDDSEQETLDIRNGSGFDSFVGDEDWDCTRSMWDVPNPSFSARLTENQVHGYEWPLGSSVTLSIDNPNTPLPIDYTDTATVVVADWDPDQTFVPFELGSFVLQSGQLVTMSQGGVTKTHTVMNLTVTDVDPVADTVSGTADPGTQVDIGHIYCDEHGCSGFRRVFANASGNWIADFAHVGEDNDEQDIVDIKPSTGSEARQCDDDGECTTYGWQVFNPTFGVRPTDDSIEGWQWPLGVTVIIKVDDPATTTETVDYTAQTVVYIPEWNPNETRFELNFNGVYDLKPGDVVTVTDSITIKTHVVTNFALVEINPNTDMVFGHASPNNQINVWACDNNGCVNREETSDQSGNWQTNFSSPGDLDWEQDTIDIQAGTWVDSSQNDEDGDGTYFNRTAGSTITGTVYLIDVAPENTVAGVMIEACTTDNFCRTNLTDESGNYWISGLRAGTYNLRAIPPGTNLPGSLGPVNISYDEILYSQDITVPAPPVSPPLNAIEPAHTGGGTIVVYWMDDLTLTTNACTDGTASFELSVLEDGHIVTGAMLETATGSGIYQAAIPSLYPHHGVTEIVYTVNCPDGNTIETPFFIYIDPSGVVKDTSGMPIQNATVTLFHADNPDGPFTEVPNDSTVMSSSNRDNPDMTNANGEFGWDVVAGFYKVRAERVGCFSPINPEQTFVESAVLTIPPPVTNLELILKCSSLPPSASAGGPYRLNEGDTVTLDASASFDPEAGELTYEWDLDNDSQYDDANGITAIKVFADNGHFTVGLRVTDPDNLSATNTAEVLVANVSPVVDIQQAQTNNLGLLTGHGLFFDPGADAWTATINYGDNSGIQNLVLNSDKSFSLNHTYPLRNGTYTLNICVNDDDEGLGCSQTQVTIKYNRPPVAEAGGPYFGNEGSKITLNASHSTDPDRNIVRYEWDYDNDGQFDDAAGIKPKFTSIDNGVFTILVRVTDAGGLSSIDSSTVTVKNLAPVVSSISFNKLVRTGIQVNAHATFKDAGVNDTFTAVWKWGDNTTSAGTVSGTSISGSHTYKRPGIYIVTVTVTDKDGGIGQTSRLIFVWPK